MRFVIYGAGAVGGVIGARLAAGGADVVLIARGAHLEALRRDGLRVESAAGSARFALPAVGAPQEIDWRPGDVVILTVKSTETAAALAALAACAPPDVPVVCAQNGVSNERAALRMLPDIYALCVMLPAEHLSPGVVVQGSSPVPGILDLGRYPRAVDATAEAVAGALRAGGFDSVARPDAMRFKYRKLLLNLGNALEALCGRLDDGATEALDVLRAEGTAALDAAGVDYASAAEDRARRGDTLRVDVPRGGGSTWQSLRRGTGRVEADHLNGEIVLLGRLHGVPTPANDLVRRLVNAAARAGRPPGELTPSAFLRLLRR
ncbi:2-dehydropantoate 2-reductase [Virgisporangium aliadipatigenens]|uniref:2-dehydropantoate 2-reductase n=1 Tax=Virgisporangium aliadipatigenens TaxID=741659 RepID=A0A8J4DQP3_9ACTN|nr:2-dehydropantoate 2-reductase [Virgisporangium aliadipatigenens]GIJ45552.1 2-dehydropantoate 2-reductase [Virgisporangium aliadipatigenens]